MKRSEFLRKSLHGLAIVIPLMVWFLPDRIWQVLLPLGTVGVLALDLARLGHPRLRQYFQRMVGPSLRRHERSELTGASYMSLACTIVAFLLPREIAVASMAYLILGDGLAGFVGESWGKRRLAFGKSWEGTLAGLAANLIAGWIVFREPAPTLLVAGVASIVELLPLPLDDNLAIPLLSGLLLWGALAA